MAQKQLTAKQEANLNSQRTSEKHIDDNISIIAAIPAFLATFNQIKTNIAAILDGAQSKSASLTGIAAGKTSLRETLSGKIAAIAGVIQTFADDTGNAQLRAEMNITPSRLKRTRDEEIAPLCQFVHDRANAHLAALADYNITAARLAEIQTLINNYSAEVPKPRAAVSSRKTTNANIASLFKENDKLFDKLDKQIETLREDHPDFVNTYFSTREIVDPQTTTTQLKGTVTDKSNGNPINGATVTVVELTKTAKTDAQGKYSFKPITNGKYTVTATAQDFANFQTENVEVKMGAINNLNMEMEK
jgi:Carboxypeptidase regulatory-like domain